MKLKIAPSILSADKTKLNDEIKEIEPYADLIHVDIMDGKFVPPTTFKPEEIKPIQSSLPKDIHLMVDHPLTENYIDNYIDAGASSITIQVECKDNITDCINHIKSNGVKVAITLNPPTKLEEILPYLDKVDMVLVMSVNPGYAGQAFIPEVLGKIKELRRLKPDLDIEIDGGIKVDTIKQAVDAGANVIVAGSAIFNQKDRKLAIENLKNAIK
jgi:ribulose-phosphate 3-epimerase